MILRRIAEAVKKQDWFVVFIEIVIVVVGIYIGLQVDDWQKERQDRQEEVRILVQIKTEIEDAITQKQATLEAERVQMVALANAIDLIEGNATREPLAQKHCDAVWLSHLLNPDFEGLLIYDELALSGKLALLRNAELRSRLVAFQRQADIDLKAFDTARLDARNVIDTFTDLMPRNWQPETETWNVSCDFVGMRANQSLINHLNSNLGRARGMDNAQVRQIEMLQDILVLLEKNP